MSDSDKVLKWHEATANDMTESLSLHIQRQQQNYTEGQIIKWLRRGNCYGETQLDEILSNILCMHKGLSNYQYLDYPSKQKVELLIANEEVVIITVETLIQWFATRVGYSVLKEMEKVVGSALPEETRRLHELWATPIQKKEQPFNIVREVD